MKLYAVYTSNRISQKDQVNFITTLSFKADKSEQKSIATQLILPVGASPQDVIHALNRYIEHLEMYEGGENASKD